MAQNFVGSNNINLLSPCGQFGNQSFKHKHKNALQHRIHGLIFALLNDTKQNGTTVSPPSMSLLWFPIFVLFTIPLGTRLMGGKDAASPRYVFTKLEVSQPEYLPWYWHFTVYWTDLQEASFINVLLFEVRHHYIWYNLSLTTTSEAKQE